MPYMMYGTYGGTEHAPYACRQAGISVIRMVMGLAPCDIQRLGSEAGEHMLDDIEKIQWICPNFDDSERSLYSSHLYTATVGKRVSVLAVGMANMMPHNLRGH